MAYTEGVFVLPFLYFPNFIFIFFRKSRKIFRFSILYTDKQWSLKYMDFKNQYTLPDLLTNESFLNFYFNKNENDVLDWEEWVEANSKHELLAKNAFTLLDRLSLKWDETEIKKRFIELKNSLSDEPFDVFEEKTTTILRGVTYWRKWAVAASILIVSVIGIRFYLNKHANNEFVIENTNPNKSTIYQLPDGTTVTLKGKSHIEVATDFNQTTRTVTLQGEAFFEVAHNANKPFLVLTGTVVTKVLGTSFSVKSPFLYENTEGGKTVEVEVVTGKVSVFKKEKDAKKGEPLENGVVLTPNQKVTYLTENEHFVVGIVAKPIIIKEIEKQPNLMVFRFDETPLSEVISKLEKAYGIQIVLSNDEMNDCPMTADLTKQPLFGKLDLVCAILKASYEIQGTRILITGHGCN